MTVEQQIKSNWRAIDVNNREIATQVMIAMVAMQDIGKAMRGLLSGNQNGLFTHHIGKLTNQLEELAETCRNVACMIGTVDADDLPF